MPKLINKPQTNLGEQTTNKTTLQFSNPAIDKYLPTFGNSRHIKIAFKVPLLNSWQKSNELEKPIPQDTED